MHICYAPKKTEKGGSMNFDRMDPHVHWNRHTINEMVLRKISADPTETRERRLQAEKEILMAQSKQEFWERHRKFDQTQASRDLRTIKQQLRGPLQKTKEAA